MANGDYDVTIDDMEQITIVENNRPKQAYRIYFTIVGFNQYYVDVKEDGFNSNIGRAAVMKKAKEIYDTLV